MTGRRNDEHNDHRASTGAGAIGRRGVMLEDRGRDMVKWSFAYGLTTLVLVGCIGDPMWFIGYKTQLAANSLSDRCVDKALEGHQALGYRHQPELADRDRRKSFFKITRQQDEDEGFVLLGGGAPNARTVEVLFGGIGSDVPDRARLLRESKAVLDSITRECAPVDAQPSIEVVCKAQRGCG